jgi:hydroxypyruvate reductase
MTVHESRLRRDAVAIYHAALAAANPVDAVSRSVSVDGDLLQVGDRGYDLSGYDRCYVVGIGKAAAAMGYALEQILGDRITGGIVIVKYGHTMNLKHLTLREAGHPTPDEAGMRSAREMVHLLRGLGPKDLVLVVISGGGSALLSLPRAGITLKEKQQVTQQLLACGASIGELNAIRKHLSQLKGGQLAQVIYPATSISLILSDVVGDRLDVIASGPTVPDSSTFADCRAIVEHYALELPDRVLRLFERGLRGEVAETPKANDPVFEKTFSLLIGSNILALRAAAQKARELGYNTLILSSAIEGETREIAKMHTALAKEIRATGNPLPSPACLISGGETTVTLRGTGLGGRNQEFVLACALELAGFADTVILSCGTDGTDGPTDAAGALADGHTVHRAAKLGMHPAGYLSRNDSYYFFEPLGDLVKTGPTNTNVLDVRLVLVG